MIDRSQFLEELRRNPELMHRIAVIVAGEVGGNAPLEKQIIQAETIFNRAIARNQTLAEVTRSVHGQYNSDGSGRGGYYPGTTFNNGERIASRTGFEDRFREQVLKPVLAGSDVGRDKLGFSPTGNASGSFAAGRLARGEYATGKWYGDPRAGGEMYVQEKGPRDQNWRLEQGGIGTTTAAGRSLQQPAPGSMPGGTPDILAPVGAPGDPRRAPLYGPGAGTTTTQAAPAARAPAQAPAPRPGGLGRSLAGLIAPSAVPPGASSYRDPNTGRTIVNPGREEGGIYGSMGLTRDIGPVALTPPPARSPAPQRPAAAAPAPATGQAAPVTPARATVPDILAPQFRTDERRLVPSLLDVKPGGLSPFDNLTPPDERGLQPPGTPQVGPRPIQAGFVSDRFAQIGPAFAPRAPDQARQLAAPNPPTPAPAQPGPRDQPAPFPVGGAEPTPYAPPKTVNEILSGISPFGPGAGPSPSITTPLTPSNMPSAGLLPFQQWPDWGYGGYTGWGDAFGWGGGGGYGGGFGSYGDFGAFA